VATAQLTVLLCNIEPERSARRSILAGHAPKHRISANFGVRRQRCGVFPVGFAKASIDNAFLMSLKGVPRG
jgi:hypothetical protein